MGDVTVVYWSLGWDEQPESTAAWGRFGQMPSDVTAYSGVGPAPYVNVVAADEGLLAYPVPADGAARRAASSEADALPDEPGVMGVLWTVLPALPEGIDVVDVAVGHAGLVTDVPVGDGLLEPTVAGPVVPLGSGWPRSRPRCSRRPARRR